MIILYHFLKLFGEKRLVKSVKLLPLNIKSTNPVQKYPHVTQSYACILKNICYYVFIINKFFNFFWNMFNPKAIKICHSFRIYI